MARRNVWFTLMVTTVIVVSLLLCVSTKPAPAASVEEFYKNQVIKIMLSSSPGGSNDLYMRLAATYLTDITNASISIVTNTAGGGLVCNNEFYNTVKPDGRTVMFQSMGSVWNPWLLEDKGIEYDITKLEYLGGLKGGPYVMGLGNKSKVKTIEDMKSTGGLVMAASGPTSILTLAAIASAESLGMDLKIVTGFKTATKLMALMQGEADITVSPWDTMKRAEEDGTLTNMFQINMERDPACPDLPSLAEVVDLTPEQKKLVGLLFTDGKFAAAPPGTPKDKLQFLSDAFLKVFNNKGYQKSAEKTLGAWYGPLTAKQVNDYAQYLGANKADMAMYKPLMKKYIKTR